MKKPILIIFILFFIHTNFISADNSNGFVIPDSYKSIASSLQNIMKCYTTESQLYSMIKNKIKEGFFKKIPPNKMLPAINTYHTHCQTSIELYNSLSKTITVKKNDRIMLINCFIDLMAHEFNKQNLLSITIDALKSSGVIKMYHLTDVYISAVQRGFSFNLLHPVIKELSKNKNYNRKNDIYQLNKVIFLINHKSINKKNGIQIILSGLKKNSNWNIIERNLKDISSPNHSRLKPRRK